MGVEHAALATINQLHERIGRAREKYARAAQHDAIDMTRDESGKTVTAISWRKTPKPGSALTHPGVYCLRTTLTEPTGAELWRIYSMLTNLEAVFRSLKTDLGLRPVHHQIERRLEGHLFVSVLAYYFVHTLRLQLKAHGIDEAWGTLRNTLSSQVRTPPPCSAAMAAPCRSEKPAGLSRRNKKSTQH